MIPQITWRNDGPLMLPGSLVGGSADCCCENPPPPQCYRCFDTCSYFIELTAPSVLAVKSSPANCVFDGWKQNVRTASSMLESVVVPLGWETDPRTGCQGFCQETRSFGYAANPDNNGLLLKLGFPATLAASASHYYNASRSIPGSGYDDFLFIDAHISTGLMCDTNETKLPYSMVIVADIAVTIERDRVDTFGIPEVAGTYRLRQYGRYALQSKCQTAPKRNCPKWKDQFHILSTPIAFSADTESTSLGPYLSTYEHSNGPYEDAVADATNIGNAVKEVLSGAFNISSRPSCHPIACNCATSLTGLKVIFEGKEFVMGTEATVSESGAYLDTWTHDAPGTFRYRKNDLSNNETYIEKEVEVYCQTDNAVSPPVDRWYAAFINWCKDEANYATTYNEDYFIGYFECEPASDCAPFSAETSIPLGSPIDVERVDGWPQGSGCTVPGPATITLSQDCG